MERRGIRLNIRNYFLMLKVIVLREFVVLFFIKLEGEEGFLLSFKYCFLWIEKKIGI